MFFEDLSFPNTLRLMNQSRYLFLEFVPQFSLLVVGNQGGHDLSIFTIKNKIDYLSTWSNQPSNTSASLERIYVLKHSDQDMRILGVNIQTDEIQQLVRIYIFTSDCLINCLEVSKNK